MKKLPKLDQLALNCKFKFEFTFNSLTALSISIALLAGVLTFLATGPASGLFLIWAATIAWATYFLLGANQEALVKIITCGSFGVAMAWIGALEIASIPSDAWLGFPLLAAIAVTATVLVLCLAANLPQLATIPASVLGYSCTFAYLLQTPDMLTSKALTLMSISNPLIIVPLSLVIGVFFGKWSAQLSAKLTTKA